MLLDLVEAQDEEKLTEINGFLNFSTFPEFVNHYEKQFTSIKFTEGVNKDLYENLKKNIESALTPNHHKNPLRGEFLRIIREIIEAIDYNIFDNKRLLITVLSRFLIHWIFIGFDVLTLVKKNEEPIDTCSFETHGNNL